jgi:hypothetical protein
MPLLPWLPAQRKKRFPVAKRSPSTSINNMVNIASKDKVSQDLSGIFGDNDKNSADNVNDDKKKKKRSSNEMNTHQHSEITHGLKIDDKKLHSSAIKLLNDNDDGKNMDDRKRNVKRSADDDEDDNDNGKLKSFLTSIPIDSNIIFFFLSFHCVKIRKRRGRR